MEKRNLFKKRLEFKPYEYPELMEFKDAIRHAYWLHTEFNFSGDIQNYHVDINSHEKNVITRSMLAISQIEMGVKRFWGDLYYYFPKPEVDMVGATFADSESRHSDAYAFLIEKLGLNDEFSKIREIPALMGRIEYMEKFMKDKNLDQKGFVLSLVLFSLFIEHISLFSQFLIIMSFNKHKNMFKGMSNAVEATSKEEEIHGKFGIELYRILRTEHSDLFTPEFFEQLIELSKHAFEAEMNIVEWIFDGKDMDFLNRDTVKNYIKQRYNNSFQSLGLDPVYEIDQKLLEETKWFDIELLSTKETDFFNKRSTDYSKKTKTITSDDLF